jgi:hypothetical protein
VFVSDPEDCLLDFPAAAAVAAAAAADAVYG